MASDSDVELGELLSAASQEKVWDEHRSTVYNYELYLGDSDGYVLRMDTYEKSCGRNFCLRFKNLEDAQAYLNQDADEALLQKLFSQGVLERCSSDDDTKK
ncbi:hypothetical protein LWC08_07155 [Desulfobaculum bizertense]|uniref:hypothetical protein n=1 Tax=Desulfobaculum bizertense TaxID=376490 RepID=UPI001F2134DD|nr:hypothetical protein [Desulfobaculum bizertense]UIJ39339.1 hypothetical protein LWC08_07155 [Desulfobaculum bizertense]